MNKKELEERLATLMNDIPEIEGLIALDGSGKVIVGQTLVEMDHTAIAKAALQTFNSAVSLGASVGKGSAQTILASLDKGSSCIVGNGNLVLVSLQGDDASTSVSLILRFLKGILS